MCCGVQINSREGGSLFAVVLLPASEEKLGYLQRLTPKIKDSFILWVALHANGSISIWHLLQQQDLKDNPFCKWVFKRDDTHIWGFVPLRQLKIGLPYMYSVRG